MTRKPAPLRARASEPVEKKRKRSGGKTAAMPLHQLRVARGLSQTQLASDLGTTQATISKMERRTDVCISTLRRYIEAMGGTLVISAHFRDEEFEIDQFQGRCRTDEEE